jgi:uncharacterized protein (DUF2062 family)/2-polyprenyl-3-methyl-5-hydroxy-6-metoxy-1,4-benzoquinol methylase
VKGARRASLGQVWTRLRGGSLEPGRAAASVAIGIFVGCMPIYGAQLLVVLAVCIPLRLDSAVAYVAAHVSNPLTIPLVLATEMEAGSLLLTGRHAVFDMKAVEHSSVGELWQIVLRSVGQLAVGAVSIGSVLAMLGALVTWFVVHGIRDVSSRPFAEARKRTLARYADAPPSVRGYLSSKLRTDPSLESIAALPGSFGRVVDAGCGYGQIGLALLELGRADTVVGFDDDPRRVGIASSAAGDRARFETRSLPGLEFPEADTVLFVDSLHYIPVEQQNTVLERAARALAPNGRIVVRDVDSSSSIRSSLTQAAERLAARFRGRAIEFGFRSRADLLRQLGRLGLSTGQQGQAEFSMTQNVLTVATKPGGALP